MMKTEQQTDRLRNLSGIPRLSFRLILRGFLAGAVFNMMAATMTFAASLQENEELAALKKLKIEAGTITSVERDASDTLTAPDGHQFKNLPPRTIVKMVLNPAKGSNINVE
ncbi:MAG: hypothetical protein PHQ12_01365, partial [Chthoniobacteraceae bacterium]|nr:hypothetical protein [Chthoniobacteraceae bacterium]